MLLVLFRFQSELHHFPEALSVAVNNSHGLHETHSPPAEVWYTGKSLGKTNPPEAAGNIVVTQSKKVSGNSPRKLLLCTQVTKLERCIGLQH